MEIAIISDTHDNLPNMKKAVEWIKKQGINLLIHCGDVCSPETLKLGIEGFSGKVFVSLGNADIGYWEKCATPRVAQAFRRIFVKTGRATPGVAHFEEFGKIEIDGKKIAFCHFPELAKKLAESKKHDLVFYGHTHKPWEEKIGDCPLINPGNLAGILFRPTFAVFDTDDSQLELKVLEKLCPTS